MRDILFTVDLDYWTMTDSTPDNCVTFFNKVSPHTPDPPKTIRYHHHILRKGLIPQGTKKIINIDFHNDIVDDLEISKDRKKYLNEGTWGNFLPSSVKEFEWRYPDKKRCILQMGGICISDNHDEFPVEYEAREGLANLPFDKMNGLVVCTSPNWGSYQLLRKIKKTLGLKT